MVKRIAAVVVAFMVFAACGAVCQDVRRSLPDAPAAPVANEAQKFDGFIAEARSAFGLGVMSHSVRDGEFVPSSDGRVFQQKDPEAIFRKYLSPAWQRQG